MIKFKYEEPEGILLWLVQGGVNIWHSEEKANVSREILKVVTFLNFLLNLLKVLKPFKKLIKLLAI